MEQSPVFLRGLFLPCQPQPSPAIGNEETNRTGTVKKMLVLIIDSQELLVKHILCMDQDQRFLIAFNDTSNLEVYQGAGCTLRLLSLL
jgi:hypothetical protein